MSNLNNNTTKLRELLSKIQNLPNAVGGESMLGIWVFNEALELYNFNFQLNFVLPNMTDALPFHTVYTIGDQLYCVDENEDYHVPYENGVWQYPDWRTITITEEPTDAECIAWLKANATKVETPRAEDYKF